MLYVSGVFSFISLFGFVVGVFQQEKEREREKHQIQLRSHLRAFCCLIMGDEDDDLHVTLLCIFSFYSAWRRLSSLLTVIFGVSFWLFLWLIHFNSNSETKVKDEISCMDLRENDIQRRQHQFWVRLFIFASFSCLFFIMLLPFFIFDSLESFMHELTHTNHWWHLWCWCCE